MNRGEKFKFENLKVVMIFFIYNFIKFYPKFTGIVYTPQFTEVCLS